MNSNLPSASMQFNNDAWSTNAQFNEYMSASNPSMPKQSVKAFAASLHLSGATRVIPMDLSADLQTTYPATSPNLLANFLRICANESLATSTQATSEMFYVIRGAGTTETEWGVTAWKTGDLFVVPTTAKLNHHAIEDSAIFWVTDSPVLQYLGVVPGAKRFEPILFTSEHIQENLMAQYNAPNSLARNRIGILFGNPACPLTKTLTHSLWSLYNILPAGATQLPHRHNSVALDYCVAAGENTYTLIGEKVDANGHIINPVKAMWQPGAVFVTPPGWWHSHHNESGENATVLPIQDAGLLTYMQVLDIQFIREQK